MRFFWNRQAPKAEPSLPSQYITRVGPVPIELVERSRALAEWDRRRAAFPNSGKWPLLIGADYARWAMDFEVGEISVSAPAAVLTEAGKVDLEKLLKDRVSSRGELDDEFEPDLEVDPSALDPRKPGSTSFTVVEGVLKPPPERVGLVELPCSEPWQILTVRPFGEWNEVPSDAEITAILKSWHERFRAVPIGLTIDVMELWLPEPISDPEVAAKLACEFYAFCPDIVEQGTETTQALAQEILNAKAWFFWWD